MCVGALQQGGHHACLACTLQLQGGQAGPGPVQTAVPAAGSPQCLPKGLAPHLQAARWDSGAHRGAQACGATTWLLTSCHSRLGSAPAGRLGWTRSPGPTHWLQRVRSWGTMRDSLRWVATCSDTTGEQSANRCIQGEVRCKAAGCFRCACSMQIKRLTCSSTTGSADGGWKLGVSHSQRGAG